MARVLLVDDDAAALDLRKLILEREGHRISIASEPGSARALFAEMHPDCVEWIFDCLKPRTVWR